MAARQKSAGKKSAASRSSGSRAAKAKAPAVDWKAKRLKGKTFCFSGNLTHGDRKQATEMIDAEGGRTVAGVTADLDYLIVGKTRGGGKSSAEKKAQSLNQKGAAIQVLDEAAFHQLFVPDRETAIAMLKAGKPGTKRWNAIFGHWWFDPGTAIDVGGADFRGCDLEGAHVAHLNLDDCDFRKANLAGVQIDEIRGAKFDGCTREFVISQARDCTFRNCTLSSYFDCKLEDCDLTGATLAGEHFYDAEMKSCRLDGADLHDAYLPHAGFSGSTFCKANLSGTGLPGADLSDCDLTKANLSSAVLNRAKLRGANLTRADLRNASLVDADLSGAIVDGADFSGANLAGVDLSTFDDSKARGIDASTVNAHFAAAGANVRELEKCAKKADRLETTVVLNSPAGPAKAVIQSYGRSSSVWSSVSSDDGKTSWHGGNSTLSAAMTDVAKHFGKATLQLDSVTGKGAKSPVKGKELKSLCLAAWCEVFGESVPSDDELRELQQAQRAGKQELRDELLAELRGGKSGVGNWNKRSDNDRQQASPFRKLDLTGLNLSGANLDGLDFQECDFRNSTLKKSSCRYSDLKKANFTGVDFSGVQFAGSKLTNAICEGTQFKKCNLRSTTLLRTNLKQADLTGADLDGADLGGADLTGATLTRTKFNSTKFDEKTTFPRGYKIPDGLVWAGQGKDPRVAKKIEQLKSAGPVDFAAFMQQLEDNFDESRLSKAMKMLKAEAFQLFADVQPDSVTGVVKSQTDPDLVYSCRLDSEGAFACCTQNLNSCGGLRGALCKHLLVLIVGLTKGDELEPTTINAWVAASKLQSPQLNKDLMSEAFLKYKGAEAGEIDWRPTETVPEDFYAF